MLLLASISERLVNFAVNVIGDLGLFGVFVLMLAESALIPIPSEATMLFAGFNVANGHYPLWQPVAVGVAANLVGSWIAYAIGYYGRVDVIEKHGHLLHIKPQAPRVGGPLVRPPWRGHGLLLPHASDHPYLHLASRRHRPHAVLALHGLHRGRLLAMGPGAHVHRQAGRRQLARLEALLQLPRLRHAGRDRGRHRLPRGAAPAPAPPRRSRSLRWAHPGGWRSGRPWPSGPSRGPPSCCRCRAPAT